MDIFISLFVLGYSEKLPVWEKKQWHRPLSIPYECIAVTEIVIVIYGQRFSNCSINQVLEIKLHIIVCFNITPSVLLII